MRPTTWRAVVSSGLVACAAGPVDTPADSDETDTDVVEPATATWMGTELPPGADDVPLRGLLLPGTFNSSSYACDAARGISPDAPAIVRALWDGLDPDPSSDGLNRQRIVDWSKTQGPSLHEQLLNGIRSLEINLTLKDGVLTTWHSVYGEPLDDALDQVVAFAATHPSEIVVLGFGLSLDREDWPAFAEALAAPRVDGLSLCDLLFDGPMPSATATLAEVRASGRPLLWAPGGDLAEVFDARGDCPTAPFAVQRVGSLSTTTEGVESVLASSVADRDPDVFLHNDFFFYLGQSASEIEQAEYLTRYASFAEALQALGFAGDFPRRLIERFDGDGQMNIFSGGHVENTELVQAVIDRTRTR